MSSYVASPFEIETRRLSGIVQECQKELNRAIRDMQDQVDRIAEIQRSRCVEEQKYYQAVTENKKKREENIKRERAERIQKKKQLANELERIQIELGAFSRRYGALQNAEERQRKLADELENTQGDPHLIEEKIREHVRRTQEEIKARSREDFGEGKGLALIGRQKAARGVSLQGIADSGKRVDRTPSKLDIFSQKLKAALEMPESRNVPGLAALKKEFDAQPDYAKSAFAVRNTEKLEEYLGRLAAIRARGQKKQKDWKKTVGEYLAICSILKTEPDQNLFADPANLMKLQKVCKELESTFVEKRKRDHVAHALTEVMKRHGIEFTNAGEQDALYFGMEDAELAVSGASSDYLTMAITGQYNGNTPTENDKRKSTAAAKKFCSMLPEIERELREEYGVMFKRISTVDPDENSIPMRKSGVRKGKKIHKGLNTMLM